MKNFVTVAAFAAGANALVGRSSSCCFHINVSGGSQGELGQLGDGQNRVGDNSLSPAQYCIDASGGITDGNGRGCILTPPTTQFQCDEGAKPTPGFSVNEQGQIEYNGSTQFYACETGQNEGLNIYTSTDENQTGCRPVNMAADSCSGQGSGNGGSSPSSGSSSSPSSSGGAGTGATPSPRPSGGSSSVPSVPSAPASSGGSGASPSGPGAGSGSSSDVTVWTTRTTSICDSTSAVPTVPVQTPGGPGGSSPSGPAGGSSPSSPAGGSQPTQSVPGGSQPTQSVPGGGSSPSSPAGGSQPSQSTPGGGSGSTPSQPAPQPSSSTPSGGNNGGGNGDSCPTNLDGEYSAPHLIVPVDSSKPDSAPGTSYNGTISESKTTLYNFDIPQSYESKTCSLVFLFPKQEDLETSAFTFSGDGKIDFAKLQSTVKESTSYSNMPSVEKDYGVTTVSPGNSYTISTFECPAGESVAYEMKNAGSTYLDFFEDYNPSPLGLYITTC